MSKLFVSVLEIHLQSLILDSTLLKSNEQLMHLSGSHLLMLYGMFLLCEISLQTQDLRSFVLKLTLHLVVHLSQLNLVLLLLLDQLVLHDKARLLGFDCGFEILPHLHLLNGSLLLIFLLLDQIELGLDSVLRLLLLG